MKTINTTTAELDIISPTLGHFTVTGQLEELQAVQSVLKRRYGYKAVKPSTMDRMARMTASGRKHFIPRLSFSY